MSHSIHKFKGSLDDVGHDRPVLFDDCDECDHRADDIEAFFAHADPMTLARAFNRCEAYHGGGLEITRNERKLFRQMWPVMQAVEKLNGSHAGVYALMGMQMLELKQRHPVEYAAAMEALGR